MYPVEVQPEILYIIFLKKVYMDWRVGFSSYVNEALTDLDSLAFILFFFNHLYIESRLVCNFSDAIPGSLSVASTAVSSANVAVIDSVEVGRSAVYNRYNNGLRTLPLVHPRWMGRVLYSQIWGFYGGDYEEWRLLRCYAVWLLKEPTFRKSMAPPSSGWQESMN
jgi:hypothetical protein